MTYFFYLHLYFKYIKFINIVKYFQLNFNNVVDFLRIKKILWKTKKFFYEQIYTIFSKNFYRKYKENFLKKTLTGKCLTLLFISKIL